MNISLLLVDDHKILRDGLKSIIDKVSNIKIIGQASDGREAIKFCQTNKPDVVVMDVAMPGLNGIEATKQITNDNPNIKVIALSMHSSKQFILGMFKAGAYGYLLKDTDSDELIDAINAVMLNKKYITQNISNVIIDSITDIQKDNKSDKLTARENEVLQLIAEGKSSKEIGIILFLSSKTVDVHRKNIMNKINLFTIPDLTKYAIKQGITNLDH